MIRKVSADFVCPVSSPPLKDGVVVLDETGKILDISDRNKFDVAELEIHKGTIVPGFVNTHCHLELSHMLGKCPTGLGLIPFISHVIRERNAPAEVIQEAIERAEREMIAGGIMAVGDISNTTDTFTQKQKGNLRYHTFVEYFDLFQEQNTGAECLRYDEVYEALPVTHSCTKSKVPHAPYSVSPKLFEHLNNANTGQQLISIHNQETPPENELFQHKSGAFIAFYQRLGFDLGAIPKLGKSAIHYALEHLSPKNKHLFVHNTLTQKEEVEYTHEVLGKENVYWAICPNANLYIENKLPDFRNFLDAGAALTIGTDSLTSNWQLSILEEMKTILRYQSYLDFHTVLQWATLNGAKALGFDRDLGSIEKGKTPGLVLLEGTRQDKLEHDSTARKIA